MVHIANGDNEALKIMHSRRLQASTLPFMAILKQGTSSRTAKRSSCQAWAQAAVAGTRTSAADVCEGGVLLFVIRGTATPFEWTQGELKAMEDAGHTKLMLLCNNAKPPDSTTSMVTVSCHPMSCQQKLSVWCVYVRSVLARSAAFLLSTMQPAAPCTTSTVIDTVLRGTQEQGQHNPSQVSVTGSRSQSCVQYTTATNPRQVAEVCCVSCLQTTSTPCALTATTVLGAFTRASCLSQTSYGRMA